MGEARVTVCARDALVSRADGALAYDTVMRVPVVRGAGAVLSGFSGDRERTPVVFASASPLEELRVAVRGVGRGARSGGAP